MEIWIAIGVVALLLLSLYQWRKKEPSYRDKADKLCAIAKENALTHRMQAMHHAALADMYVDQYRLLNGEANGLDNRSSESPSPFGDPSRSTHDALALGDPGADR